MSNKRRNYNAEFKAKIALEAIKGELTISELAAKYEIHPTMIHGWKRSLLDGASGVFAKGSKKNQEAGPSKEDLYKEIGKLKVERDFLAKGLNL